MYVAGVLMQLCCGALMWAGWVDALSYITVIIAVLRGIPPIAVGTQRTALIHNYREGDPPGGRVCVSLD